MAESDFEKWPNWLKEGMTGQFVEEKHLDIERIRSMFKEFSDSEVGQILFLALEDFKEFSFNRLSRMSPNVLGYDVMTGIEVQRIQMATWLRNFLVMLEGFKEQAQEAARDITNYK